MNRNGSGFHDGAAVGVEVEVKRLVTPDQPPVGVIPRPGPSPHDDQQRDRQQRRRSDRPRVAADELEHGAAARVACAVAQRSALDRSSGNRLFWHWRKACHAPRQGESGATGTVEAPISKQVEPTDDLKARAAVRPRGPPSPGRRRTARQCPDRQLPAERADPPLELMVPVRDLDDAKRPAVLEPPANGRRRLPLDQLSRRAVGVVDEEHAPGRARARRRRSTRTRRSARAARARARTRRRPTS